MHFGKLNSDQGKNEKKIGHTRKGIGWKSNTLNIMFTILNFVLVKVHISYSNKLLCNIYMTRS